MKNFGLVLISLSLGAICDGLHVVAKVNDEQVNLEVSGYNVTAVLIKKLFDHNSKVSIERVDESVQSGNKIFYTTWQNLL